MLPKLYQVAHTSCFHSISQWRPGMTKETIARCMHVYRRRLCCLHQNYRVCLQFSHSILLCLPQRLLFGKYVGSLLSEQHGLWTSVFEGVIIIESRRQLRLKHLMELFIHQGQSHVHKAQNNALVERTALLYPGQRNQIPPLFENTFVSITNNASHHNCKYNHRLPVI